MDPFSIFLISTAASGAMQGVSGWIGQLNQARSLKAQAYGLDLQSQALGYQEQQQEQVMRENQAQQLASNELSYLASNIDPSEGTPLKMMTNQAYQMEKDIQTYRYNVQTEQRQMAMQAQQLRSSAKKMKKLAPLTAILPMLKAGGDIAGGLYSGKVSGVKAKSASSLSAPSYTGDINLGSAARYA